MRRQSIERERLLAQLRESREWDVVVIGGGATGLGIAVDAAARGFRTALIEARDFASGTSSRSTKLIHGGVRYLAQGNVKLVREALVERALLLANAPALVRPLKFIVPCYRPFERELMRVGLGVVRRARRQAGIGDTHWLSRAETIAQLPGVKAKGLRAALPTGTRSSTMRALRSPDAHCGAAWCCGDQLRRSRSDRARAMGVWVPSVATRCHPPVSALNCAAKVVFNATGVWADELRRRVSSGERGSD